MEISIEALKKRYQYEHPRDLIGKGGFADVYKAYDTEDQIWVALKFYKGDWSSKYNVNNEIRRIKKYRHENLIEHIEAYEVISGHDIHGEPIRYQVGILEFANAGPLTEFIKNKPPQQVLGVVIEDVMEGLRYLHTKNIVHRDLKPHNILLCSDGERLTAKIADFGIARLLDGSDATSSHVIGTIEYMSPEHFAPNLYGLNGKMGINADLWALGVMIYEMYTGGVPFGRRSSGNTQQEIIANILNGSLMESIDAIPQPYQDIVRRCLVRNANERARSIDDLRLKEVKQENAAKAEELKEHEKEAAQRATKQEAVRQDREAEAATLSGSKKQLIPPQVPLAEETNALANPPSEPAADPARQQPEESPSADTVTMKSGPVSTGSIPRENEGDTVTIKTGAPAEPRPTGTRKPSDRTPEPAQDESTLTVKHRPASPAKRKEEPKRPEEPTPARLRQEETPAGQERSTASGLGRPRAFNRPAMLAVGAALVLGAALIWVFTDRKPASDAAGLSRPDSARQLTQPAPQAEEPLANKAETKTSVPASDPVVAPAASVPAPAAVELHDGLAVKTRSGRFGYVDGKGKWVIQPRFDQATQFRLGRALVVLNGRTMTIDRRGRCLEGCDEPVKKAEQPAVAQVEKKSPVVEAKAEVKEPRLSERDGRYGFVDGEGKDVIKFRYQGAKAFSEGLAAVNVGGRWGYINTSGALVIVYTYEAALSFRSGRARVLLDGEWFYIDKSGNKLADQ